MVCAVHPPPNAAEMSLPTYGGTGARAVHGWHPHGDRRETLTSGQEGEELAEALADRYATLIAALAQHTQGPPVCVEQ